MSIVETYSYRVLIETFAAGEVVLDGTDFRNGVHLRFKADLFVPCGGR
jgi:glutamate dehydrogenase